MVWERVEYVFLVGLRFGLEFLIDVVICCVLRV